MKHLRQIIIGLLLSLLCNETGSAQTGKPMLGPDIPRKALVRNGCVINTFVSEVEVGGSTDLNNIMDADLENYGTVIGVASVGTLVKPMLLVKDTEHDYAAGTKAGFCLQAGGSNSVLSLEVLKNVSIFFYKDGELVDTQVVDQGTEAGLLNLGLIQIPGEEEGVSFVTATSDEPFDEIGLVDAGVNVDVGRAYKIRYAFVGNVVETALTTTNYPDKNLEVSLGGNSLNIADKGNMIDGDTTNWATQPKILVDIGANITLSSDTYFKKGTEVGFVFEDGGLLDVAIGSVSSITVTDTKMGLSDKVNLQAQVLGVGLIENKKRKISIIAPRDFNSATLNIDGLKVTLGARKFYYGFVCEPTVVPHPNDLQTTMDSYIGMEVTEYTMFSNKAADWEIVAKPDSETGLSLEVADDGKSCTLKGMTPNVIGDYQIKVTSKECSCVNTITLKRGNLPTLDPACKQPIAGDAVKLSDEMHESSGSLISISKVKYPERIIDEDMNSYAEYTGGLSIAQNLQIIGIKNKEGGLLHDGKSAKKVGFVMEMSTEVLDAQVLEFFQIRLYNKGVRVLQPLQEVIKNTNVVSAGLIGGEQSAKARFGIEIPAGVAFDEMTIWKSGVLNLGLSSIRIYGAYITDEELDCYEDPLVCGSTVINKDNHGAYINYNHTGFSGVSVGATIHGLEHVIDNDRNTCAIVSGVSAGTWEVAVYLGRTMDRSHQACVILDNETYLASLTAIGTLRFSLYREDVFITDVDNWGVLGLNAIGNGDKTYLFINSTATYDEIRITSGKLVGVETIRIYGVAVRDDMNQNGIPDCLEDELILNVSTVTDLCVGEHLFLTGAAEPNLTYNVKIDDLGINTQLETGATGEFLLDLGEVNTAVENAPIKIEADAANLNAPTAPVLFVTVHPKQTRWKPDVTATHWNTWANWEQGTPWSCTDVIIPRGASSYPELLADEMNACHYIHFEPGAEVVHTHRLDYEKAWVELAMKPNRYYMVAVPLKETRSGDWFIPADGTSYPDLFTVLNETTAPANRITPTIYQRLWEADASDRLINGKWGPVYPATSRWTKPFNLLAAHYDKEDGFALSAWVHPSIPTDDVEGDPDKEYIFRFPKEHGKYFYVNAQGATLDLSESMRRDEAYIGRFITEDEDSTVTFPVKLWVRNEYPNRTFLVPNPFMSHIDVTKFLAANPDIAHVQVYDGTGNNALIAVADGEEGLLSSQQGYTRIAPLQSFFITVKEDRAACEVQFTEEMLCAAPEEDGLLKSADAPWPNASSLPGDAIYLRATVGEEQARAMLYFTASASDAYVVGEDAEVLLDTEAQPAMELFTAVGEQAFDIQQRAHGGSIPLGFYLSKPASEVQLTITLPADYAGWTLEDMETGDSYPLRAGVANELSVGPLTTHVGRFQLKGVSATGNESVAAGPSKVYAYTEAEGDLVVVRSQEGLMCRCEIFTVEGRLSGIARFESDEYRMRRTRGVNIIKVYFTDGRSETLKLLGY